MPLDSRAPKGLELRGALGRLGVKKEEKWREKEDWQMRPPWFGEKRSRLLELGLWRKEVVDGGRERLERSKASGMGEPDW